MLKLAIAGLTALALGAPLSGCASLENAYNTITSASLTTTQVYVAANAFDAVESTASQYDSLPLCATGGPTICHTLPAVKAVDAIMRPAYAARQQLVAACAASITAATCVSAYTTVTTAVKTAQGIFTQYSIATKG